MNKQAAQDAPPAMRDSGLSQAQIMDSRARLDAFEGRFVSRNGSVNREALLKDELPKGATLAPNRISGGTDRRTAAFGGMPSGIGFNNNGSGLGSNSSNTFVQGQRPYQPEFDSVDRLSYPVHRILANRYWRMFHKMDPVIGTGIDILSEMWVSNFQLSGDGIEGSIKTTLESMVSETKLLGILPHFSREFLVSGECVPHTIWDDAKGHWVHISLHNPDQLEVIDAPFLHMDPIVEFVPDDRLRQIVNSSDPALQEVRNSVPGELAARIQSGQNIPLDSLNVTFIPRKLHMYDSRGTSIISRLWRILMFEDSVFTASIATARRHAAPLRVVKMGNERTGWIPGPAAEAKMADLLAKSELDPLAFLVTHYGVNFEAWGVTDRVMSISRELDAIERLKLIGLGISKALVTGEVTYSSAEKGLQVLLYRLKTFRNMVESKWLIPKYFRGVAKLNDWRKITKSESRRNYRIKRNANDVQENDYITPTIEWETALSPRVDEDMQKAIEALAGLGINVSKTTASAVIGGLNYEKEQRKIKEERELDLEISKTDVGVTNNPDGESVSTPLPSAPGEAVPAPKPPLPTPTPPGPGEAPVEPTPGEEAIPTPKPPLPTPKPALPSPKPPSAFVKEHSAAVSDFLSGDPNSMIDSDFWRPFHAKYAKDEKINDPDSRWAAVDQHLADEGFLDPEIDELHTELVRAGALHDPAKEAFDACPDDSGSLSDDEFNALLDEPVKKKSETPLKTGETDTFFTGAGDPPKGTTPFKMTSGKQLSKWSALNAHFRHNPLASPRLTGESGRFDHHVDAMPWDSPTNMESRNEWQNRLTTSKLPDVVKSRVRYLENSCVDQWETGFDTMWAALEGRFKNKTPLTTDILQKMLSSHFDNHVSKLHTQGHYDAFADIYAEGKLSAYKPFKYDEVKRKRLKSKATSKIAITVDSVPERAVLDSIAESALVKVKDTLTEALKLKVLQIMTTPGSYKETVVDLANRVILEYQKELENDPNLSRHELKKRMRDLYDTQVYNIQRVMRTEAVNAYARATLLGYKEQGIVKVKWKANQDNITCNVCAALHGHEFEVDYLLTLGAYPISGATHPNCRCALEPVASFVSFDEYERQYEKLNEGQFSPTQTIIDADAVRDLIEVIKDIKTAVSNVTGVPVEYGDEVTEALAALEQSDYVKYMPAEVQIVPDVASTPMFQQEVGEETAKGLTQQITHYRDNNGKAYVSGFAVRDKSPAGLVMRTWAQSIWDNDEGTRTHFQKVYDSTISSAVDAGMSPASSKALLDSGLGRVVGVGSIDGVVLNKEFKDLSLNDALGKLQDAGVTGDDARNLVNWKDEYVVYDKNSGNVVEMDLEKDAFINNVAAQDPEHMFIESVVAFHTAPRQLEFKDPALYDMLAKSYFKKGETQGGEDGETT